ncbi:hypothetical protein [Polyangium aurulentum]|uniref:hypothetical protein n=1 Tax=Polyangium aurulentum TaxID=2567896 RepID=UPI0010ADF9A0|nr:hypothetical protein [Polyangium aurulentum]UQA58921.1 hypothetical protein E8A73_048200 [Polyangium aurulentum]
MELGRLLQQLIVAARKADITVRAEPFDPGPSENGKKCLDERAPLAASLASVDLEHVLLPPIVRATIGAHRQEASARPLPNLIEPRPPVRARRRAREESDSE